MSDARKTNPTLGKAAIAVEGLFGWPLQNDPIVKIKKKGIYEGTFDLKYNYLRCEPEQCSMMHEIIHSEDSVNPAVMELLNKCFANGKNTFVSFKNNFIYDLIIEGRAYYGEQLLSSKLKRTDLHFYAFIIHASLAVLEASVAMKNALHDNILFAAIYGALSLLFAYFSSNAFKRWGFKNSIFQLAKKVGDPVKAFRITTDKIPRTMVQIFFPSKFYKDEIAQALRQGKEEKLLLIA